MRREKRSDFIGSSPRCSHRDESTGNCQWFVELAATLGHDLWIGDAAKIRATTYALRNTIAGIAELILEIAVGGRSHESGHRLVREDLRSC